MVLSGAVLTFAPFVALAQSTVTSECSTGTNGTIFGFLCVVGKFLQSVIPVLILLGVIFFVWGVVSFVIADDEEAKSKGRDRMIYGIVGLAVIIGMWGLVNVVLKTFNLDTPATTTDFPTVEIPPQ